jgi:hypothetical protein
MRQAAQPTWSMEGQQANKLAEVVPLHRLTILMGRGSLDTPMLSIRGTKQDLWRRSHGSKRRK